MFYSNFEMSITFFGHIGPFLDHLKIKKIVTLTRNDTEFVAKVQRYCKL